MSPGPLEEVPATDSGLSLGASAERILRGVVSSGDDSLFIGGALQQPVEPPGIRYP
jgi:hypothetical protein